jgi:hypothetical protein
MLGYSDMYMLTPKICSEHASYLYNLASGSHLCPRKICSHCYEKDHH